MKTKVIPNSKPDPISRLSDNVDALRKEVSALNLALAALAPVLDDIRKALEGEK
jgi:hypothetical protein